MLTLDSKKKKIVIVADPHNDYKKLDKIITKEDGEINICLGDWFDSFVYDDPHHYSDTAKYLLEEFIPNKKNYTLFGNHDLHYLFDAPSVWCSGYEQWKFDRINDVIEKHRGYLQQKFHWACVVDGILLTHAGLDRRLLPPTCSTNDDIFKYLDQCSDDATTHLKSDDLHWFYQVGHSRGGRFRTGGIVWCDFDYEFQPIEDLNQIVGHTSQWKTGRACQYHKEGFTNVAEANNICIDCHLNQYITITNGKIELKDYVDL
jgi:hypothetical protein